MPALKNQRHEMYCQELAKGKSATDAYAAAGYKPSRKNASNLKTYQGVIARVQELQGKRADRIILNKTYVVDALLENAEKALGRKPVKVGKEGQEKSVFVYEGAVANAAIRLAGQELGMFIDRKDFRLVNEFDKLTDAQLAAELARTAQLLLDDQSKTIEHEDNDESGS